MEKKNALILESLLKVENSVNSLAEKNNHISENYIERQKIERQLDE